MNNLEERKFVYDTALELYNKLLRMYKTQYDKLEKAKKETITVENAPENGLILYLDEDDLTLTFKESIY